MSKVFADVAHLKGFTFNYHHGSENRCPGCGKSHWLVGRMTAECAFCHTALDIEGAVSTSTAIVQIGKKHPINIKAFAAPLFVHTDGKGRNYLREAA